MNPLNVVRTAFPVYSTSDLASANVTIRVLESEKIGLRVYVARGARGLESCHHVMVWTDTGATLSLSGGVFRAVTAAADLPETAVLVRHQVLDGSMSVTIFCRPDNVAELLPEPCRPVAALVEETTVRGSKTWIKTTDVQGVEEAFLEAGCSWVGGLPGVTGDYQLDGSTIRVYLDEQFGPAAVLPQDYDNEIFRFYGGRSGWDLVGDPQESEKEEANHG